MIVFVCVFLNVCVCVVVCVWLCVCVYVLPSASAPLDRGEHVAQQAGNCPFLHGPGLQVCVCVCCPLHPRPLIEVSKVRSRQVSALPCMGQACKCVCLCVLPSASAPLDRGEHSAQQAGKCPSLHKDGLGLRACVCACVCVCAALCIRAPC